MKRGWWLLLVLSLGLNLGLALAALRDRDRPPVFAGPAPEPGLAAPGVPGEPPFAPGGPGPEGPPPAEDLLARRLAAVAAKVGIPPETVARMVEIRRRCLAQVAQERLRVRQERRALHEAFAAAVLDTGQIRARLRGLAWAQGRVDSLVTEAMLRELSLLTPAQRAAYLDAMPWGRGGSRDGGGRAGHHGPWARGGEAGRPGGLGAGRDAADDSAGR
jgi:hypothetical protein